MPEQIPGHIAVRTFASQDEARVQVSELAAHHTADLLLQMDLVTSDGGGLGELQRADGAEHADYLAFRAWFGPQIHAAIQAAVGRVLSGAHVDTQGRVVLDLSSSPRKIDPLVGFAGRLDWLIAEIELLQEAHGQLYADEWPAVDALLAEVDALDLAVPADLARARELWPQLEEAYLHAQAGARIFRGDDAAVASARGRLDALSAQIEAAEAKRRRVLAMAAGDEAAETTDDLLAALGEARQQRAQAEAARDKLREKLAEADATIHASATRITELMLALPDDVDPGE